LLKRERRYAPSWANFLALAEYLAADAGPPQWCGAH
jgi:hypothetical protein